MENANAPIPPTTTQSSNMENTQSDPPFNSRINDRNTESAGVDSNSGAPEFGKGGNTKRFSDVIVEEPIELDPETERIGDAWKKEYNSRYNDCIRESLKEDKKSRAEFDAAYYKIRQRCDNDEYRFAPEKFDEDMKRIQDKLDEDLKENLTNYEAKCRAALKAVNIKHDIPGARSRT